MLITACIKLPVIGNFLTTFEMLFLLIALMGALPLVSAEYTLLSVSYEENPDLIDLHLIALSPVTGSTFSFGYVQLPVYEFALKDIGKSGLLPGYRLVVHLEDSKVRLTVCKTRSFEHSLHRPIMITV